jgi:outer membrane protein assembly factor BamB
MFRGNPTRSWYGTGPLPQAEPAVLWRYPDRALCGPSTVGGETTTWCGTGWTGQPVVWERPDGITEVIVGAYDHQVHFIDASNGLPTRAPFPTGDIVKGSVTLDPDGFPLLYFGSRDNHLRALALDREPVAEVWSVDAADHPGIWNNDWDSNPVVVEGLLLEGGENGYLFVFELNREIDDGGKVTLDPVLLARIPTWDPALIAAIGDRNASVESSIAVFGATAYVTNSGGRVLGIDLTRLDEEEPPIVFDFWTGDDTDATPVVDADGYLYVASELERRTDRSLDLGQLMKLDPLGRGPEVLWSIPVPALGPEGDGGLWATPALGDGVLYASTHPGQLLAVDTDSGDITWTDEIGFHAWSSPVVVDGVLLLAVKCELGGALRAYDLTVPRVPVEMWEAPLQSGCIESTPAVWNGVIYVGSRDGFVRAWG